MVHSHSSLPTLCGRKTASTETTRQCNFPRCVCVVCETAHASRALLLCDSMLYNQMEGDEESSEVLTDNTDSALSIRMPAMAVQSLSVILISGIASL